MSMTEKRLMQSQDFHPSNSSDSVENLKTRDTCKTVTKGQYTRTSMYI